MNRSILLAITLAAGTTIIGVAAGDPSLALAEADTVNSHCPIGKEPIDGKTFVEVGGEKIGFCCPGCDDQFLAWDDARKQAYVKGLRAPKEDGDSAKSPAESKAWGELYPLSTCPVSGLKLGAMGDSLVKNVEGREVRFCCGGCLPSFEKNTADFLRKIDASIAHDQGRYYPLAECVVTGTSLTEENTREIVVRNRLFRVASAESEKILRAGPEAFAMKLDVAAAEAQRKDYPLETCVVAGGKLGSMGEPTELVVAGRLLRFCCASCEPKVKTTPAKYLATVDRAWNAAGRYALPESRPRSQPR